MQYIRSCKNYTFRFILVNDSFLRLYIEQNVQVSDTTGDAMKY